MQKSPQTVMDLTGERGEEGGREGGQVLQEDRYREVTLQAATCLPPPSELSPTSL